MRHPRSMHEPRRVVDRPCAASRATREECLMRKSLCLAALVCLVGQPGFASEAKNIVGSWKLVSYVVEIQATGQIEPVMGQNPTGYVNFSPEGRVWFVLTAEGRKPAKTAEERAQLLSTLVAYT